MSKIALIVNNKLVRFQIPLDDKEQFGKDLENGSADLQFLLEWQAEGKLTELGIPPDVDLDVEKHFINLDEVTGDIFNENNDDGTEKENSNEEISNVSTEGDKDLDENMDMNQQIDAEIKKSLDSSYKEQQEEYEAEMELKRKEKLMKTKIIVEETATVHWSEEAIQALIDAYKNKFKTSRDTGTRNAKIWDNISEALKALNFIYSNYQCKHKFARLKAQYRKVVDARGPNNSGGKSYNFKYYDEMHLIFGKCHGNILPGAQSSLSPKKINLGTQSLEAGTSASFATKLESNESNFELSEKENDLQEVQAKKKRRRITVGDRLKESVDKIIEQKEKQHKEKMQKMDEIEKRHNDLIERLIEKI